MLYFELHWAKVPLRNRLNGSERERLEQESLEGVVGTLRRLENRLRVATGHIYRHSATSNE